MLMLLAHAAAFIPSSSFSSTSVMRGHTSPHLTRPLVSRVAQPPSMLAAASVLSSPLVDPIATGFELVTLVPQPFWLLLILLPNWKVCAASLNGTLRHTAGRILIGILPGRRPAALHPFTHARPTPQGTRAVFEPIWPLALLGLVHLGIVGLSTQGALTLTLILTLTCTLIAHPIPNADPGPNPNPNPGPNPNLTHDASPHPRQVHPM